MPLSSKYCLKNPFEIATSLSFGTRIIPMVTSSGNASLASSFEELQPVKKTITTAVRTSENNL